MSLSVTANKNEQVKAGTIVFVQGQPCKSINFLMEGEIEILTINDKDLANMKEDEILENSQLVCTLQENTFFGVDSVLTGQNYNYSIRASKNSIISIYPTEKLNINALIQNKLNYSFLMARSLVKLQQKSILKIRTLDNLIKDVQRIQDTLAIVFMKLTKSYSLSSGSQLSSYAHGLWEKFKESGVELPVPLTLKVLKTNYEKQLDKKYGFDSNLEKQKINFLYKFFSSPSELQMKLFQHDVFILKYMATELADEIGNIMGDIERAYSMFKQEFVHFTNEKNNWMLEFAKILEEVKTRSNDADIKLVSDILKYLKNLVTSVEQKFLKEFQFKIPVSDKVIATVEAKLAAKAGEKVDTPEEYGEIPPEAENTLTKLLDWSDIDEETRKDIIKSISDFKRAEDKMSDESSVRKLRRNITNLHWKLFEKTYLKTYKSGEMPRFVELYLNFGLIDETLLKKQDVAAIWAYKDSYKSDKYPIYYTTEWLNKIFKKDIDPSIDELGQSFYEIVREEHRDKLYGRKLTDLPEELDTGEDRVKFEIRRMLRSTVKTTNGQLRTAVPILLDEQIWREVDAVRVTRKRLEQVMDDIMERDFSVFHRQVLYKNPERNIYKLFIMKQVIPNFILVPSAGIKVMMWQDLDGRSKSSQGRFVIPTFATDPSNTSQYDDLFILMLRACAVFRWELLRSILGHAWTDPTESSLTSDYMDYIQFYKKNAKLSPEAKEKISTEFKRYRQDRDKFVNDYLNWVIFEYDGQMKLNVVVREIFYKHAPFKKEYREKLGKSPRYLDIHTRRSNINKKKLRELQNKYYKYTKDGQTLPQELQNNLDFFEK